MQALLGCSKTSILLLTYCYLPVPLVGIICFLAEVAIEGRRWTLFPFPFLHVWSCRSRMSVSIGERFVSRFENQTWRERENWALVAKKRIHEIKKLGIEIDRFFEKKREKKAKSSTTDRTTIIRVFEKPPVANTEDHHVNSVCCTY